MSSNIRGRLSVVTTDDALGVGPTAAYEFGSQFVTEDVTISSTGLKIRGKDLSYNIDPNELEIGEAIGKGSCSVVRKALHRPTGTVVALKVINVFDSAHRHQLVEEVKSLSRTDCPAIVKFYGAFLREGSISIVLEFLDGGSLANVLEQVGPVPESVLANITYQVLWGLCYLKHEHRIHRDIKPQNILINSRGQVKLTDFGISKELITSVAMGKTFVGSFGYMAPERLQNRPHTYASDIWGLGIVLYEMAVGRSPFSDDRSRAETYIDIVQSVVHEPVPGLPEVSPSGRPFSDTFRRFVSSCLDKNPENRFTPEALLTKPWLQQNGATSLDDATANVKAWIMSLQ
jgi:serine/threonine protein kinase